MKLSYPSTIRFGEGALGHLESELERLSPTKVVICTDTGIIDAGVIEKVTPILEQLNIPYRIYSDINMEPSLADVDKALESIRNEGDDLIIGVGGGSPIDVAKAIALLSENPGYTEDYMFHSGKRKIGNAGIPSIIIPTTAGTGSEVTNVSVFAMETNKDVIQHDYLLPNVTIVDPELTYGLPSSLTAASGIDAFTHALEAYISVNSNPASDALAVEAIQLISGSLRKAMWSGDKNARKDMALGSLLAGMAFGVAGVCGGHALGYSIGGRFHVQHAQSVAVMCPHFIEFIAPAVPLKMKTLANILGDHQAELSSREAKQIVLAEVKGLITDIGFPLKLSTLGIHSSDIKFLSDDTISQKRLLTRNPRPMAHSDIAQLYANAQ